MVAYITHELFLRHEMGINHPECPDRLRMIQQELKQVGLWRQLNHYAAKRAHDKQILLAHGASLLAHLHSLEPLGNYAEVDPDTLMNRHSLNAAYHAAGAGVQAVELISRGYEQKVFCAVRPPGHHAENNKAMGFCFFNNIAIAALYALQISLVERIAILDFDVHHGNGTVDIFKDDSRVLVCSSFQHPFYPNRYTDIQRDNIVLTPLFSGCDGDYFRQAVSRDWLPALKVHRPQLLLISAGFDAHKEDPLGGLLLEDDDFYWLGKLVAQQAGIYSQGHLIAFLEGGYHLSALSRCVVRFISGLSDFV